MRINLGTNGEYIEVTHTRPTEPHSVTAIFLHGFMSTQAGEKAGYFRDVLVSRGAAYITFDFRGHGQSSGTMRQLTGTRLLEDCHAVIEQCCPSTHRIVLIGSSMGGWVASWYAAQHPERITAAMLIAPSFDFGRGFLDNLNAEQQRRWAEEGVWRFVNEYGAAELGYELIQDMTRYPLTALYQRYCTPTLICHGLSDDVVDYRQSLEFQRQTAAADVDVLLLKQGDHRLTAHKQELAEWLLIYWQNRWAGLAAR